MTMTQEERDARKAARKEARIKANRDAEVLQEKNQRPIKKITFNIEWKKSRTWGSNPHCTAQIEYKEAGANENRFTSEFATCSGCGYDKESTVIAQIFNKTLKYKLWAMDEQVLREKPIPYGVSISSSGRRYYDGGIGTSCYYKIAEFIGGKFEKLASGKSFDVFVYEDGTK